MKILGINLCSNCRNLIRGSDCYLYDDKVRHLERWFILEDGNLVPREGIKNPNALRAMRIIQLKFDSLTEEERSVVKERSVVYCKHHQTLNVD